MNEVLISVIIPIYNVEPYLAQCLNSVLDQDYKKMEIICVDDASTDGSSLILKEYSKKDPRITIITNNCNQGVGISRNIGLKAAKGEYIHYLDPDDWLEEYAYSSLMKKVSELPSKPEILYFNYKKFDNIEKTFIPFVFKNKSIMDKVLNPKADIEAFDNWDRYCWTKLIKADFLNKNNIKFKNYVSLSDVEWAALLYTRVVSLCYVDVVVVNYRTSRVGSLVTKASRSIKDILKSYLNNKILYKNLNPELKYRLLAFDYIQLPANTENAYKNKYINVFELLYIVLKSYSHDFKNYIFLDKPYPGCDYRLNFFKIYLKTKNKALFDKLVCLKKKLLG